MSQPEQGRCARCQQSRIVHPPKPQWGEVKGPLCTPCWQVYDEARAAKTYVDWSDAFDNASDEEIEASLRSGNR